MSALEEFLQDLDDLVLILTQNVSSWNDMDYGKAQGRNFAGGDLDLIIRKYRAMKEEE